MGGGTPRVRLIFQALAAARGTALNASDPSTAASVETLAVARQISAAWDTNDRLALQWDARRMSPAMLTRWEKIYAITPDPADDLVTRRARLAKAQARVGRAAILTALSADLQEALGAVFIALEFISPDNAVITVPDVSYPFGLVVPGSPWSSTASSILVRVEQPAGYSAGDFYEAVGRIANVLEPAIPSWVTWHWYRAPEFGAPINVVGGPSAAGFYLDERNLNNSVFAH